MAGTSQTTPDDRGGSQDDRSDPATEAFVAHRSQVSWRISSASAADPSIS